MYKVENNEKYSDKSSNFFPHQCAKLSKCNPVLGLLKSKLLYPHLLIFSIRKPAPVGIFSLSRKGFF